jgi:Tol biopolymer transport system component
LEKDWDFRYQHASDIRTDLKRLKRDTSSGKSAVAMSGPASTPEHGSGAAAIVSRRPLWRLWLAGSLVVVLAGLAVAWFFLHRTAPQPATELTKTRLTFNSSEDPVFFVAISADGKYLAYSDLSGIHVKLLSNGEERLIPRPAEVPVSAYWGVVSWFPDDTQLLANSWEPGGLPSMWTVSVLGQSQRELREAAVGFDVSPEGARIAFAPAEGSGYSGELWEMGSQGENPQKVVAIREDEFFGRVHWSPDGQRLSYLRLQRNPRRYSIETCDLKGSNRTVLVSEPDKWVSSFCWLADGRVVYPVDSNLWQVGIERRSGVPTGKPRRITQWAGSNIGRLSASADGKRLALLRMTQQQQVYLGELAPGGTRMNAPRRLTNDEASDRPSTTTLS